MQIGKGKIRLSLFADDRTVYVESLEKLILKKLFELVSDYSKFAGYKVNNLQKSITFLYNRMKK